MMNPIKKKDEDLMSFLKRRQMQTEAGKMIEGKRVKNASPEATPAIKISFLCSLKIR